MIVAESGVNEAHLSDSGVVIDGSTSGSGVAGQSAIGQGQVAVIEDGTAIIEGRAGCGAILKGEIGNV